MCLEWASGDPAAILTWDQSSADGVRYHTFQRQDQEEFAEVRNQASWGTWYWSTADVDGVSITVANYKNDLARLHNLIDYLSKWH